MIKTSPQISKYFKVTRSEIRCVRNNSNFTPLATSDNQMDGRLATAFVADEVGALRNRYPISAMESSQMNLVNKTGILISTAYDSISNPMTEEVEYAEKVIDGLIEDKSLFALLYRPDDSDDWLSDKSLYQANPLLYDVPENLDFLKQQRFKAINMPTEESNFKTKHLNIFVDGASTSPFLDHDDFVKGKLNKDDFDWKGKEVYVGVDLSKTDDNTAVSMIHYDWKTESFYSKAWAFVTPHEIEKKEKREKVHYRQYERRGYCFFSGEKTMNYGQIENFVMTLEKNYGVKIKGIAYDTWNAISSASKWFEGGYEVIAIKQYSSHLHPPTKLLKESVLGEKFFYERNPLLETHVSNAKEVLDTNLNSYINKKKSSGKIDMLASLINAMAMWKNEIDKGYVDPDADLVFEL